MKKPSTKKPVTPVTPAKSPAPATVKAAAKAPAKVAAPAPAPAKKAIAKTSVPAPAPKVAAPAPIKQPAIPVDPVNPPAAAPSAAAFTAVTAQIDVGFGNTLFIRGEGPGLNWNKGLALKNAGSSEWTISLPRATRPIIFKFLINDEVWSSGEDYKADPGALVVLQPGFSLG
jgi:hypothetical protein